MRFLVRLLLLLRAGIRLGLGGKLHDWSLLKRLRILLEGADEQTAEAIHHGSIYGAALLKIIVNKCIRMSGFFSPLLIF